MNELLMPADAIKYTSQGDYACSWCGYLIPINSRHELQEWCSAEVAGLFCNESHAIAATNSVSYRASWLFNKEAM
jgi:hypothetical protein